MRHFLSALLFVLAASGCGATSMEDAQEELNAYARSSHLYYSRDIRETDPARGLRIVCSRGQLCDGSGTRVWEYQDEQVWLRIEFTPGVAEGPEGPRASRYRASWSLGPLDGLSVPGWSFTTVGTEVPSLATFASEEGLLEGRLATVSRLIQGHKDDPEACTDDAPDDQNWPRGCFVSASTEIEVHLSFLLPQETGVVDCRGDSPPERCR